MADWRNPALGECSAAKPRHHHLGDDSQAITLFAGRYRVHFPVLLAELHTAGVYSILYRNLFDRRRDLETPVLLLLAPARNVFKVNGAESDPAQLLRDFASASENPQERLARALPFPGQFHADPPRRNFFTYGIAFIQNEYPDAALACFQASL